MRMGAGDRSGIELLIFCDVHSQAGPFCKESADSEPKFRTGRFFAIASLYAGENLLKKSWAKV